MSDLRLKQPNKTRDEIARSLHWDTIKGTHKFRYFYFIGSKKEKKEMMKSLLERYSIEPYPKGDNERYDSSYKPAVQLTLFDTVPSPVKKVDNSKDRVKNERTEH